MTSFLTRSLSIFLSVVLSIGLFSCKNHEFKVKGEIYGAEDQSLILEKSDFNGSWKAVDSTRINKNGGFSITFPVPPAPDIYRLNLNGRYIYFPVQSKETISINSSYEKFGNDFSITGSPEAEKLGRFEKELHNNGALKNTDSLHNFKRHIYSSYMKDSPGSIVNFYILTKTVNGKPLYSPEDPADSKYFAAVATGFKSQRPDDPHTALLEQTAIQSLKNRNSLSGNFLTYEADEITLIDIEQQDENGITQKLSDIVGKGKPVVVIFSLLNLPESPEFNIELSKIYNRMKGNVEFFNVSIDEDRYDWREAAKNLPWITVYSPGMEYSEDAKNYNIFQLPTFFIYNSKGELIERVLTLDELNKSVSKL